MVTKYIIMCGGDYKLWETPRQLSVICGEVLLERTIRLLRENGINDISISSNNPVFENFGVPVLHHDNLYIAKGIGHVTGDWFNAFYPTDEPVCYIFGDVYFSPQAIKTIVETETDDIELFGSHPPFASCYIKNHVEPFALKVKNQKHLHEAIETTREWDKEHKFWRKPIVWELFTVIKNAPLQTKLDEYTTDYVGINDYTVDIDNKQDILTLELKLGGKKMVTCEVIEDFTLREFDKLTNIKRKNINTKGKLYVGDTFDCDDTMANYLTGGNAKKKVVVKILEIKQIEEPIDTNTIEYHEEELKPEVKIKITKKKKSTKKK